MKALLQKILDALNKIEAPGGNYVGGISAIACIALFIIPIITLFNYISFLKHKEQVSVSNVAIVSYTHEDSSKYYNGTDCINIKMDLDVGKYNVHSFGAHILVYYEDEFINVINYDINKKYEANNKYTINFRIEGHGSEYGDEEFYKMWLKDKSRFKFDARLIYITFEDSTMVGDWSDYSMSYYDANGNMHHIGT